MPEALVKESWLPARKTPSGLLCGQEISSVESLECFRAFRITPKRSGVHHPGDGLYLVPGL